MMGVMKTSHPNSFGTRSTLKVGGKEFRYFSLPEFAKTSGRDINKFPYSMKVLLENLLRLEDNLAVKKKDIETLAAWNPKAEPDQEI
ncbi:MAG: hypothetical protein EBX52_07580, partial [Proteobacteria bacterium]|nr:hypothetical protein [Pseudomonadota bacterium]